MSRIFDALQGTRSETADLLPTLMEGEPDGRWARTLVPAPAHPVPPGPSPSRPVAAAAGPVVLPVGSPPIRRVKLAIPATVPALPFENQNEAAAEQYRIARTKIVHHPKKPRTIGVTSPGAGDGKTVTAINLAGALSLKAAAKVLLVDVDFRRSAVHALLGLPKSPGLAEVIEGSCSFEEAVLEVEGYPNLNIITAGESKVNPSELLESARWHAICERFRAQYEFAILDTPPVGVVADWDLIQLATDGIVLVFRPDHTKRSSCAKVIEAMPKDKLIGVLLNHTKPWPFGAHAGYGYGSQSVYGAPPAQEGGRPAKRPGHKSSGGK